MFNESYIYRFDTRTVFFFFFFFFACVFPSDVYERINNTHLDTTQSLSIMEIGTGFMLSKTDRKDNCSYSIFLVRKTFIHGIFLTTPQNLLITMR